MAQAWQAQKKIELHYWSREVLGMQLTIFCKLHVMNYLSHFPLVQGFKTGPELFRVYVVQFLRLI